MKKYLLPLILILLLTFALIGNCAWLSGYDQRIKLTIDNTKIDGALSDFPVTVFFTDAQAEEIFVEFDEDADFDRGQFALANDTLLYAECEKFDDSAELGFFHIKVPTVSSSAGTDIYFYYDNDANHNTTYISKHNGAAAESVWDGNFKAVYHMKDATASSIYDSTSNDNDGTKLGVNNPIEAAGKVGQGQNFDGSNDYVDINTVNTDINVNTGTILTVIKRKFENTVGSHQFIQSLRADVDNCIELSYNYVEDEWYLKYKAGGTAVKIAVAKDDIPKDTWTLVTYTWDTGADELKGYVNDSQYGETLTDLGTWAGDISVSILGAVEAPVRYFANTYIDETRISSIVRSAAWIKATYNSLWDTLLTYGSEETSAVEANAIFFGTNF